MISFTKEQKKELNRLEDWYGQVNRLSNNAGTSPDKWINEFSYKFMDVSELNRQQTDEKNEVRNKTFQNNHLNKSR